MTDCSSLKIRFFFCLSIKSFFQIRSMWLIPSLGLVPWRSPSLDYAKKGWVGRLRRRPSGHGGYSVPMNLWTNAGGSIDGHLPIAWRMPYKRVYPRLKAGDAIDASIPMHEEECMPQAAALRMSLRVPARNEWTEWMSAPHDCDMCPSNAREETMDRLSLECGAERIGVCNLLGDTAKPPQSVTKSSLNDRFHMASHWECFVAEWCLPRPARRRS